MESDKAIEDFSGGTSTCEFESDRTASEKVAQEKIAATYHDSGYNRDKTLIAKYITRILDDFPTPTERYYDIRFVSANDRKCYFGEVGDQCIMFHSNKICLVTLAPTHPVISCDKTITDVEFSFEGDSKIDRLTCQPKGKRKRGGQKLRRNAPICALVCSDSSRYIVTACIGAKLIEINRAIMKDHNLIKKKPLSSGFIAIIQPNEWAKLDEIKSTFPKLT